jgi:hypothetical protein
MRIHLLTAMTLGLLAAGCQLSDQGLTTTSQSPPSAYPASYPSTAYASGHVSSSQVCADYGFSPGTAAFDRCVQRERAARSAGRVNRDYAEARLADDARNACASYGLQPNSARFDQCVGREIDARRYQGASQASPAYRTDQYGNRIDSQGYRIDSYGNRLPRQG